MDARPGGKTAFLGDQIYDRKHCFLADGHYAQWLGTSNASRAPPGRRRASPRARWPRPPRRLRLAGRYIETFLDAVRSADWSSPERAHADVVATMKRFLPTDELQFLMELSIEPVAAQLGLASPAAK